MTTPLLRVRELSHRFAGVLALQQASLEVYPGEVVAVVGESGSGKTTLLNCIAGRLAPTAGEVLYRDAQGCWREVLALSDRERRVLARTEWGFVEQQASDGLRMDVSAGANIGERLMGQGLRHYGQLRQHALNWMQRVELDTARIDDTPRTYSGGMRQRLQIARNLVTRPRLVLMDEPTSGLDVSVQARLLDLMRGLVARLQLSAVIVTHDLGVARLLAQRTVVMSRGQVVEQGLTDRVLDDPQHAYTQLLVSSVVTP
jgi:putative phosphonate transport system ATP-binding protein